MDEAGQAMVGEALIPLLLCDDDTKTVLSGDPRQLGPVLKSQTAKVS